MEDTNCKNAGLIVDDRESDSTDSSSPTPDSPADDQDDDNRSGRIENHQSKIENSREPIQNRKSKIQKEKRPFVVTPRRRAAMLANLDKARAAPKDKIYGPSEKRSAANHANLQKAHAARAAARAEKQAFSERVERLFPPFTPGNPSSAQAGSEDGRAAGIEAVREVAERVWQRRRLYPRRARSEGRKVMRLLTAAARWPAVGSMAEALQLLRQLLEIFLKSKAVEQAERLNAKIGRLLQEMLEARYGPEVFVNGFSVAKLVGKIEANLKRWAADEKAERAARRRARDEKHPAGQGSAAEGGEGREQAAVEPPPEAAGAVPGAGAPAQAGPPIRPGRVPELPEKFEDFLKVFSHAFSPPLPQRGTATEGGRVLLHSLAWAVWERLHIYGGRSRKRRRGCGAPWTSWALKRWKVTKTCGCASA